jgi:hypothetical protein
MRPAGALRADWPKNTKERTIQNNTRDLKNQQQESPARRL